ncbi:MAG: molybdate ABC transporter substrate-binding protein [Actinomycetota bacterium]|nr:MAG: molybdate ABC transporter substrate-binding protein [Actinomycetota bacterium]
MNRRRQLLALVAGVAAAAGLAACGDGSGTAASPSGSASANGSIVVYAAASLQESFTQLGKDFEAAHPGAKVTFSFGASSALAAQLTAGAPADVFAAASPATMTQAASVVGTPATFAVNTMQIAVPPENPAGIAGLPDLAKPTVKVAVCQSQVPCGATAAKVFSNAGITVTPVTAEVDVKAVLTKVSLGEVDAGVVYVTDVVAAANSVKGIVIPAGLNASTAYPVAVVNSTRQRATATAFVDLVTSPAGHAVLARAGFAAP